MRRHEYEDDGEVRLTAFRFELAACSAAEATLADATRVLMETFWRLRENGPWPVLAVHRLCVRLNEWWPR